MLTSLTIQNYALIQELNISFTNGLSIITGETGAGKSILLGALSLLVGQRADTGVLLDGSRKCIVEGTFKLTGYGLEELFTQFDLDFEETSVVRREISPDGKSRAFVNDTPVNISILKDLGEHLIDIHSQHQNLYLENPAFQLRVLDTFARQFDMLQKYRNTYQSFRVLQTEYQRVYDDAQKNKADLEYYQFQYDQLNQAKLMIGEQETLEEELKTLLHSEEIKSSLATTADLLSGEGNAILSLLKEAHHHMGKLQGFYPPSVDLYQRLDSMLIEMKDVAHETQNLAEHIEFDPERTEYVKQRLDLIYSLYQKHRVSSLKELIFIRDDLKQKTDTVSNAGFKLDELKLETDKVRSNLENIASEITTNRRKVIPVIEGRVDELLKQLGIPNGIFKVDLLPTEEFSSNGKDKCRFLFSANRQGSLQELSKVASGGEMARLMLSIKAAISEAITLPTIIFDEIDAGVSGDIADKMGNVIFRMADHAQVINITHLPQIASKGNNHFLVYKHDVANKTQTNIKLLKSDERVIEIARMLSGEKLSEAAINNAKSLLGIN
jgi:DNA repair protein RecN (Recombination protein N)